VSERQAKKSKKEWGMAIMKEEHQNTHKLPLEEKLNLWRKGLK